MISDITLKVSPKTAAEPRLLETELLRKTAGSHEEINDWRIVKRSYDARRKKVEVCLTVRIASGDDKKVTPDYSPVRFSPIPETAPRVVIVGAGPAGLFAALKAIELGLRPIVLERGKDVDSRRLDIAGISRSGVVPSDSNFCFGEGGAGTFSDGKLFTRSKKRGNVGVILSLLHQHGASEDILIDSHPHIGSDKLPGVVKNIRKTIIENGGEVRFSSQVKSLIIENGEARGVVLSDGSEILSDAVILATGHSARDTIRHLYDQNVGMECKGIAMGVRLEHPQPMIDRLQYHSKEGRGDYLPAAEYNFVTQVKDRGVYSFCMCPGGVIVPAASASGEQVVNGMSASARSGKWANSGMVVQILPGDFPEYEKYGELQLLYLQEDLEKKFFDSSQSSLNAPAQRMTDFVDGKISETLPGTSYAPGIHSDDFNILLPPFISSRLKAGFISFDKKCKGFLTPEAKLIGLESRTSSPVRLPRDKENLEHIGISRLYPAGEGAGYAGGIVSAAIDGSRCMEEFFRKYCNNNSVKIE